ncbi:hypothetical protein IMZ48_23890 [Candidatus Bathyarchaeota archaeon]|nr:hypothetical protein [Candidatus Bathyarchaeota archaeon]
MDLSESRQPHHHHVAEVAEFVFHRDCGSQQDHCAERNDELLLFLAALPAGGTLGWRRTPLPCRFAEPAARGCVTVSGMTARTAGTKRREKPRAELSVDREGVALNMADAAVLLRARDNGTKSTTHVRGWEARILSQRQRALCAQNRVSAWRARGILPLKQCTSKGRLVNGPWQVL